MTTNIKSSLRSAKLLVLGVLALDLATAGMVGVTLNRHRTSVRTLPTREQAIQLQQVISSQSPAEGRENALRLLEKSDSALRLTITLVDRLFFTMIAILLANLIALVWTGKLVFMPSSKQST